MRPVLFPFFPGSKVVEAPRLVRTNYMVRTGAFAYCFLALGLHLLERGASLAALTLFTLQFLVYPHLLYIRAMHSARPTRAELDNLFIDSTLFGIWAAYLGFPTWITYALIGSTMLNATVNRGMQGALFSLGCSAAGAALYLAIGMDAFRRVHPDDADHARVAVLRSSATGKSREVALRLVDRDGRMRQYKTRIQAIAADVPENGVPRNRLLLVSRDVTDLAESEERLLLQAHALEGMTEAIVITSADGTVLTVNRAFSEITGYEHDDVLGQPEKVIRNALQPPEYYDEVYATVQRKGYWSGTQWSRRKNGSVYHEWRSIRAIRGPGGATTHYVMVFYEVGGPKHADGNTAVQP